jgi:DNA repair photolyase
VYLYRNLPGKLAEELDNPRRRLPIPWIAFNTASDSFQTHPRILETAYRAMKVLLDREIGFSFLTKGWIPDRFIDLFSGRQHLILSRIGLVSTSSRYQLLFEPFAASVEERLHNIERLKGIGVNMEIRIDPIIPFYTDDDTWIRNLLKTLAARGIKTISLSYLHMRPAIMNQLRRELPPTEYNLLRSCFHTQPWSIVGTSTKSKLIPRNLREKGYRRFTQIAEEFGMRCLICSCKNPDLPGQWCTHSFSPSKRGQEQKRQLSLFSC